MNEVFSSFISQFEDTFFAVCETGFKTELVIQMFYRTYQQDSEIIRYGQKADALYFLTGGSINLFRHEHLEASHFMVLTNGAIFGDYAILYDLKFNVLFKTSGKYGISMVNPSSSNYDSCAMMCVKSQIFMDLCELYPKTKEKL